MVEQKIADTILQKPMTVNIAGIPYNVASPSVATIIDISGIIGDLPEFSSESDNDALFEVLRTAKDFSLIGEIVAVLILGSYRPSNVWYESILRNRYEKKKRVLACEIMTKMPPTEINDLIVKLLGVADISGFFGISVFLKEVRMTKRTAKAE